MEEADDGDRHDSRNAKSEELCGPVTDEVAVVGVWASSVPVKAFVRELTELRCSSDLEVSAPEPAREHLAWEGGLRLDRDFGFVELAERVDEWGFDGRTEAFTDFD